MGNLDCKCLEFSNNRNTTNDYLGIRQHSKRLNHQNKTPNSIEFH